MPSKISLEVSKKGCHGSGKLDTDDIWIAASRTGKSWDDWGDYHVLQTQHTTVLTSLLKNAT